MEKNGTQILLEMAELLERAIGVITSTLCDPDYWFADAERDLSAIRTEADRIIVWIRDMQGKDKDLPPEKQDA